MADLTFVAGDTAPAVFGTLTVGSAVLNLTAAQEVRFQLRSTVDRRYAVDAVAVIVTAASGAVRYDIQPGDLSIPGDYLARWRVLWNDDSVQHTEPENTVTIDPA